MIIVLGIWLFGIIIWLNDHIGVIIGLNDYMDVIIGLNDIVFIMMITL
jgi:hypothetical protein